ncbi:MAG: glycosyltransferase family 4 protein [Persicimonas sp.]
MNIWMTARATGNPYMTLLVEHLHAQGVVSRASEPQETITADLARYGRPDILHLHWLNVFFLRNHSRLATARATALAGWFNTLLRGLKRAGTGLVWTAHNSHNHEMRRPKLDRFCHETVIKHADAILAHSQTAKEMLVADFDISDADKVRVIPHGHYIDSYPNESDASSAREALGLDEERPVFVYFGRIRPYKNIPRLVDAFTALTDKVSDAGSDPARRPLLVIAGSVSDERLEAEIRRHIGAHADIVFHPAFIPDEDIQLYMNAADAVVLPYREILTSGTAVLAMSFGRAVIAPRLGTLRDVLDQQNTLLYPTGESDDLSGLVAAMEKAMGLGRTTLEEIGRQNLERARHWDWSGVARATRQVYESILS